MSQEGRPQVAMVLTQGAVSVDGWVEGLRGLGVPVRGEATVGEGGSLSVDLEDGARLGLVVVPSRIPGDELEAFRGGVMLWPDAAEGIDAHDGHVIVVASGGAGDAVDRRLHLVAATVATARHLGALGIYWSDGPMLTRTDAAVSVFMEAVQGGALPLMLFVGVDMARTAEGRVSALTRGFTRVGLPELWLTSAELAPGDLWEQTLALADYVLSNGAVLEPGQTVGGDEEERVEIVAAASPDGSGETVLRMDFP